MEYVAVSGGLEPYEENLLCCCYALYGKGVLD